MCSGASHSLHSSTIHTLTMAAIENLHSVHGIQSHSPESQLIEGLAEGHSLQSMMGGDTRSGTLSDVPHGTDLLYLDLLQ